MPKQGILAPSRLRLIIQSAFTLWCLYVGYEFHRFVSWVMGQGPGPASRPPSVEGFLPISAMMALKQFVVTGQWDVVHPAGLTLLLAFLVMAFLFRKGFCGYICPVGLIHNLLERAGRKLRIIRAVPRRLDMALTMVKYAFLGFFLWTILGMDTMAIGQFLRAPYNLAADAKMLQFFTSPSGITLAVLGVLAALGLVAPYFWCRFLCPYGALLGLFSLASPLAVRREDGLCTDCGRCTRACPAAIRVQDKGRVYSPECVGCMQCVGACPEEGCLRPEIGGRAVPAILAAAGTVVVLLGAYAWGVSTGHWDSGLAPMMFRRVYMMVLGGF